MERRNMTESEQRVIAMDMDIAVTADEATQPKKDIKIIALDMDGVMNSTTLTRKWIDDKFQELEKAYTDYSELRAAVRQSFRDAFRSSHELVFPEFAERLTRICKETGALILWSSTWRTLPEYARNMEFAKEMFNRRGMPGNALVGYTPDLGGDWWGTTTRGSEIAAWINGNTIGNVVKCAVLDDRMDAGENLPNVAKFFHTWESDGLTEEIANQVMQYLKD
jgi:hypothetical protein